MLRLLRPFFVCLGLLSLLPLLHAAPSDEARLAEYRLTLDQVKKLEQATAQLAALKKQQPNVITDKEASAAESFSQMAQLFRSKPAVRQAIEKSGISTDDFVLCMMSLTQAAFTAVAADQQPPAQQARFIASSGTPLANVEFYRKNKAYLQEVGKRLQAAQGGN